MLQDEFFTIFGSQGLSWTPASLLARKDTDCPTAIVLAREVQPLTSDLLNKMASQIRSLAAHLEIVTWVSVQYASCTEIGSFIAGLAHAAQKEYRNSKFIMIEVPRIY